MTVQQRFGFGSGQRLNILGRFLVAMLFVVCLLPLGARAASPTGDETIADRPPGDDGAGAAGNATPIPPDRTGSVASPVVGDPSTAAIDRLIGGEAGVYGVVLMRPDGTVLYRRNAELPFVAASLYKLVLLADISRAVVDGSVSLDTPLYVDPAFFDPADGADSFFDVGDAGQNTTVEEALLAAGAYSSNVAAKALMALTTTDDLTATIEALGLAGTFIEVNPQQLPSWPPKPSSDADAAAAAATEAFVLGFAYDGIVNITTPMDVARYFQLLTQNRLINKRVSGMVRNILEQQVVNNRFPALLPAETRMIHKTGNLEHVVHDAGVIYGENGPMILVAMSQGAPDEDRATQIEQRLALIAYGSNDIPAIVPATPAPEIADPATPVDDRSGDAGGWSADEPYADAGAWTERDVYPDDGTSTEEDPYLDDGTYAADGNDVQDGLSTQEPVADDVPEPPPDDGTADGETLDAVDSEVPVTEPPVEDA